MTTRSQQGFVDISLVFEFEDTEGDIGTISKTFTSNESIDGTSQYFLYEDVVQTTTVVDTVDFNEIDRVAFSTLDENIGTDFTFNFIQTSNVPFEFSTGLGLLVSGGFFGFLAVKIKKAKKFENLKTD